MADQLTPLTEDDESPASLRDAYQDYLAANVDGWAPSPGALEVAIGAAWADEASVLYALLGVTEADRYRDFGEEMLDVPAVEPTPAYTSTTWTARGPAPAGGYELFAGTPLALQSPNGAPVPFEVLYTRTLPEGASQLDDVVVQAILPGAAATGAAGEALFDEPPAWVLTAVADSPAIAGAEGETPEAHTAKIKRAVRMLSRAPIDAEDLELAAQDVPEVHRALVRDNFNDATSTPDSEDVASIYPITSDGQQVSEATEQILLEQLTGNGRRRLLNQQLLVGRPSFTDVAVAIMVSRLRGFTDAATEEQVEAAIRTAFSPAIFGQPPLGQSVRWELKRTLRLYEVAAVADRCDAVNEVIEPLTLNGLQQSVVLAGNAPLPRITNVDVTVVAA